jgi:hypothetical protein
MLGCSQGYQVGGSFLKLTPSGLAKIGYLYLKNGRWEGRQVIPAGYVRASTQLQSRPPGPAKYGYHWWVISQDEPRGFFARGFGGQYSWSSPRRGDEGDTSQRHRTAIQLDKYGAPLLWLSLTTGMVPQHPACSNHASGRAPRASACATVGAGPLARGCLGTAGPSRWGPDRGPGEAWNDPPRLG